MSCHWYGPYLRCNRGVGFVDKSTPEQRAAYAAQAKKDAAQERAANTVVLEHRGRKYHYWETYEGFVVSGLNDNQVALLNVQGMVVTPLPVTYAPCSCGAFSKYRTKAICDTCGAGLVAREQEYFVQHPAYQNADD